MSRSRLLPQTNRILTAVFAVSAAAVCLFNAGTAGAKDVWEINIGSFARKPLVIESMQKFSEGFYSFREENRLQVRADGVNPADVLRRRLLEYYTKEFAVEYAKKNKGKNPDLKQMFGLLGDDSAALQFFYIRANRNPLGSKHLLDRSNDKSSWSAYHAAAHPQIRDYLDYFGLYDIFLVDIHTGDVVYTVYKELDFSTNLLGGPYSATPLGEVFRKVKESDDPSFTYASEMRPYTPSYEAPARFVGAPVYAAGEKVGVVIFQLPTGI